MLRQFEFDMTIVESITSFHIDIILSCLPTKIKTFTDEFGVLDIDLPVGTKIFNFNDVMNSDITYLNNYWKIFIPNEREYPKHLSGQAYTIRGGV